MDPKSFVFGMIAYMLIELATLWFLARSPSIKSRIRDRVVAFFDSGTQEDENGQCSNPECFCHEVRGVVSKHPSGYPE